MAEALRIVTTLRNELEASVVCGVLSDAGIRSMSQASARGGQWNPGVPYDVYVADGDYARAQELLGGSGPPPPDGEAEDRPTSPAKPAPQDAPLKDQGDPLAGS
jgi:hypothetical protein